jgi:hypothetical protein
MSEAGSVPPLPASITSNPVGEGHVMSSPHSSDTVEYRPIKDFPGYRVGNNGSVESCKNGKHGFKDAWKPRKLQKGFLGRLQVTLSRGGKVYNRYVHHLVLEAFIGLRPDGTECCHNNGKPWDNRLDNLRWDTRENNYADRDRHGTTARGEKQGHVKLTEVGVLEIKRLLVEGVMQKHIAKKFNVSKGTISKIKLGETWFWLKEAPKK